MSRVLDFDFRLPNVAQPSGPPCDFLAELERQASEELRALDRACERALLTGKPQLLRFVRTCDGAVIYERWHAITVDLLRRYEAERIEDFPEPIRTLAIV